MDEQLYIEQLKSLKTFFKDGQQAPHKVILLLAILEFIEEGVITKNNVVNSDSLKAKFKELWSKNVNTDTFFLTCLIYLDTSQQNLFVTKIPNIPTQLFLTIFFPLLRDDNFIELAKKYRDEYIFKLVKSTSQS